MFFAKPYMEVLITKKLKINQGVRWYVPMHDIHAMQVCKAIEDVACEIAYH